MALYQLTQDGVQMDGKFIPNTTENKDWNDYQKWLSKGNTPDPFIPVPAPSLDEQFLNLDPWVQAIAEEAFPDLTALKARVATKPSRLKA